MSCPTSKNSYETRSEAKQALRKMLACGMIRPGEKWVYLCEGCSRFHIGGKVLPWGIASRRSHKKYHSKRTHDG